MSNTQTHIIRQEVLLVEMCGSEADGLLLQRKLPLLCGQVLQPALAAIFDHAADPGEYVVIERLDVDLGEIRLDRLEAEFAEAIRRVLASQIDAQIPATDFIKGVPSGNAVRKTEPQAVMEALTYFLETGTLPWWFKLSSGATLEQTMLRICRQSSLSNSVSAHLKSALAEALTTANGRKRWFGQFSDEFHAALLTWLEFGTAETISLIKQDLAGSGIPPEMTDVIGRHLWIAALDFLPGRAGLDAGRLVAVSIDSLPAEQRHHPDLLAWLARRWPGNGEVRTTLETAAEPPANATVVNANPPPKPEAPANFSPTSKFGKNPRLARNRTEHIDLANGLYVDCAGLILLHPFLPSLFETLGVADDGRILQPERALCLLHFLATGQESAPEYALALPKLLCNIPLETPVAALTGLTGPDKDEAMALLEAVIGHWQALRNTSPDGLRGTFLVRPGKLSLRGDGDYLLRIETQTFDILLDDLPWGISIVKFPWMEKLLWVEWEH
jgi:hypothetical protein